MIEKNEMSKCMYMQLRLTIPDFEKIPQKLICNDGRIMSFTMLVFEVKKNILSKWRG